MDNTEDFVVIVGPQIQFLISFLLLYKFFNCGLA